MGSFHRSAHSLRLWTILSLVAMIALGALVTATPAEAHGGGETDKGYILVQQALGHLAHDTGHTGIELATEKIDDALRTKDQQGIDVSEIKQAKAALAAGRVQEGRVLLQLSIAEATSRLKAAVGEETGTKVVLSPLPGRGNLSGGDWALLVTSLLLVLLGGVLAWRFGPADNIGELRRRLSIPAAGRTSTQSDRPPKDTL